LDAPVGRERRLRCGGAAVGRGGRRAGGGVAGWEEGGCGGEGEAAHGRGESWGGGPVEPVERLGAMAALAHQIWRGEQPGGASYGTQNRTSGVAWRWRRGTQRAGGEGEEAVAVRESPTGGGGGPGAKRHEGKDFFRGHALFCGRAYTTWTRIWVFTNHASTEERK